MSNISEEELKDVLAMYEFPETDFTNILVKYLHNIIHNQKKYIIDVFTNFDNIVIYLGVKDKDPRYDHIILSRIKEFID